MNTRAIWQLTMLLLPASVDTAMAGVTVETGAGPIPRLEPGQAVRIIPSLDTQQHRAFLDCQKAVARSYFPLSKQVDNAVAPLASSFSLQPTTIIAGRV